jgi:hypothetical protein
MSNVSWYAEASLVEQGHVYCAGSLAQCVRRWARLTQDEQATAMIKLHKVTDGHIRMERDEIAQLALQPELTRV